MYRTNCKPTYSGIYQIVHVPSGKRYIGQATNISTRWSCHRHSLRTGKTTSPLYNAIRKHGIDEFFFTVLEKVEDISILTQREQFWLDAFQPFAPNGYNIRRTAESNRGLKRSKESIAKMVAKNTGQKRSQETRQLMSKSMRGLKRAKPKPEHIKARADANRGKKRSPEFAAKIAAALGKSIQQIDSNTLGVVATFPSRAEAGRQTGITSISRAVRSNGKFKAGGYFWKYSNS